MGTQGSGATRAGGGDIHNEDVFRVHEGLGLYVVCDGVGDTPAGELAARRAADSLEAFISYAGNELDLHDEHAARAVVDHAMDNALSAVAEIGFDEPEAAGSATTITMLLAHGRRGVIGHRGDSRAYLIRGNRAQQLTIDHELTQEAESGADRPDFQVFALDLKPGDTIVLCSDGAEEVVQDKTIVRTAAELSPRMLASRIVSLAHRYNDSTDATAVVIRVLGERDPAWLELSRPPTGTAFGHTLELAL